MARADRKRHILTQLEEIDEKGYKWEPLKNMRKKANPKHCKFNDKEGNKIEEKHFAWESAKYLTNVQWKKPDETDAENTYENQTLYEQYETFDMKAGDFTMQELNKVLKQSKLNKHSNFSFRRTPVVLREVMFIFNVHAPWASRRSVYTLESKVPAFSVEPAMDAIVASRS